jgi:hypothetical protein
MAVTTYCQPYFVQAFMGQKLPNLTTDTLNVGLIATGPGTLAARTVTQGYEYVSQLLANNGSALTEVSTSGTGYSRQSLVSVTWTLSALVVTLTASNPAWTSSTFTSYYGWLHDETVSSGTDATRPLLLIWDFGGAQPVTSSTFTLVVNASGLETFTMAI